MPIEFLNFCQAIFYTGFTGSFTVVVSVDVAVVVSVLSEVFFIPGKP